DGISGDDVTHNARTIRNIPLRLRDESETPPKDDHAKGGGGKKRGETSLFTAATSSTPSVVEVRGEIYISRQQFARINQQQEEAGLEPYANPRNTAAGTLKQLDPKVVASRKLEFLPHGAGQLVGLQVPTYHEWQDHLKALG